MDAVVITESEILDALAAATAGGPAEARTGPELQREFGIGEKRLRNALRLFNEAGRLEVHRVARMSLAGAQVLVPAYTIKPAPKASKKAPKRR